jgi:Activator of Hsp90 ATPase homolog 1-like protein
MELSPISHRYELRCSPAYAFEIYTQRIGTWWDPVYTRDASTYVTLTIEPRVGGRVFATHAGSGDDEFGRVTRWEPGDTFAATSILAQSPEAPSLITVRFGPSTNGCVVHFEHGGWTQANAEFRSKFTQWPVLLDRFAALAERNGR